MAAYFMVLDGDGPGQPAIYDAHDGCDPREPCGGCDSCLLQQAQHYGATVLPVHWIPTLPLWKREAERKRLEGEAD